MSRERPATILKFFTGKMVGTSEATSIRDMLYSLADELDNTLPDCAEKSAGLRKLLEASDCFVRALAEAKDRP
jgi:hypothetical protein